MNLMFDDQGHAVIRDGRPVYTLADGKEVAFDAAAVIARAEKAEGDLVSEKIGGAFGRSKYVADALAIPAEMLHASFGQSFKIESGALVGYDGQGNKLYSRERPGEVAGFDEALSLLIKQSPHRDQIVKGETPSPVTAGGSTGAGGKVMPRTAFEGLSPSARMAYIKAGGTLTD